MRSPSLSNGILPLFTCVRVRETTSRSVKIFVLNRENDTYEISNYDCIIEIKEYLNRTEIKLLLRQYLIFKKKTHRFKTDISMY